MENIKQLILPDVLHGFGIAVPPISDKISDDYLNEYEQLCEEKYRAYVEYYPENVLFLMEEMGKIGGRFGGISRRFKCDRIIEVLRASRDSFNDGYSRFSITSYQQLSKTIFGISPTRNSLLSLIENNEADGRITRNGQNIDVAMQALVSEHVGIAEHARNYVKQSKENYQLAIKPIKEGYDERIDRLKRS